MWKNLVVAVSTAILMGCVAKMDCTFVEPELPPVPNTTGVITVLGKSGFAHACPCEDGFVYTAGHVAGRQLNSPMGERMVYFKYMWTDGMVTGMARGLSTHIFQDLGILKLVTGVPTKLFPRATKPLEVGDKIYWVQFQPGSFESTTLSGSVEYFVGDYAWISPTTEKGSSGSCVFNDAGEVVGIVVWATIRRDNKHGVILLLRDNG